MTQKPITYESFSKIILLVAYLDKSATSILNMLADNPSLSEGNFRQVNHYAKMLIGIRDRAQKIKTEWMVAIAEQNAFSEKIINISGTFENIQKDFKKLYEVTEHIFEVEYFIDPRGILIKKIKAEMRDE